MATGISVVGNYSNTGNSNYIESNNISSCFYNGIEIKGGFSNSIISNSVSSNGADGILVRGGQSWSNSGQANRISQNSVSGNQGLGIDLQSNGNRYETAPTLTAVSSSNGIVTVSGHIAASSSAVTVEIFASYPTSTAYPTGSFSASANANQGDYYLGTVTLPAGTTTFSNKTFSLNGFVGTQITATATDGGTQNTSELSNMLSTVQRIRVGPPIGVGLAL